MKGLRCQWCDHAIVWPQGRPPEKSESWVVDQHEDRFECVQALREDRRMLLEAFDPEVSDYE